MAKTILTFLFIGWCTISLTIWVYLHFLPETREKFLASHEELAMAIYTTAWGVGCGIVWSGIHTLLVFIPESWGMIQDGEFITFRRLLSIVITIPIMMYVPFVLERYDSFRTQIRFMRVELSIRKKLGSHREFIALCHERLNQLRETAQYGDPEEEREVEILQRLILRQV